MRGGKREGAGRPSGAKNLRSKLDAAKFQYEMQSHLQVAMDTLIDVAENGKSESARVTAASEIINRAVGRALPAQTTDDFVAEFLRTMMSEGTEALEEEGMGDLIHMPIPGLLDP